jgi:uncharacterized protein YecE (DUF72 family)
VSDQLELFDFRRPPEPQSPAESVGPAAVSDSLVQLAAALPPGLHLGTSSWNFPGWRGIVFDREASEQTLSRHGLAAYARHPVLRMVGIDRTYYAPITADQFALYADATPEYFRFLVKAHELCLLPTFGAKNRYRRAARDANPTFLDPAYAADQIVRPAVEGLREKLGPIVFQFTPLNLRPLGGPNAFVERLRTFLLALPRGPLYSVEIRNEDLLTERYLDALDAAGAAHCFNVHPKMPSIAEQVALTRERRYPAIVVRWMLGGDQEYETARDRYAPFDKLIDEDPVNRDSIALLCLDAIARRTVAYTIANNKAEGAAPLTIFKLAERIVTLTRRGGRIEIDRTDR